MKTNQIKVLAVFVVLSLGTGCKKENNYYPQVDPSQETRLSIRYDWVETPGEVQIPKGTTLLLYGGGGGAPASIKTGLDGYTAPAAAGTYSLAVYNRDLTNALLTGTESLDSLSFRTLYAEDGTPVEPGWLLGAVQSGVKVNGEVNNEVTLSMHPYVRRVVLLDANLTDAGVVSYVGSLEGPAGGIRLADRSLLEADTPLPVRFARTDSGWVSTFLSFGIHPDYPCRLNRTLTFTDGHKETATLDLSAMAAQTAPLNPGETHLIRLEAPAVAELSLQATSLSLSGNYLLSGTEAGVFVAEYCNGAWTGPVAVQDREGQLAKSTIRQVALSGNRGLAADTKGNVWWISKSASSWTALPVPVPAATGKVREVKGFGFSVTIGDTYAAISAPGSSLAETDASGNYTIYEGVGVVCLYPLEDLAAGKTNTCRLLTPTPLLAMTGYGQSVSFGKENRLAIGVNDGIRSYGAELRRITPTNEETILYAASPALGCPFVCTDGETLLAGSSFGTAVYGLDKNTLTLFPADLPIVEQTGAWAVNGDWIVVAGNLYQKEGKGWQLHSSLTDVIPMPGNLFPGWGRCCSISNEWVVVSSDHKVHIIKSTSLGS